MPKIIWCGNKSWDTDFPENTLPNNAKRIERPDNIFKSSLLYGILPLIFSYAIICIKWFMIGEKAMNPIYVPFGIILGLLLLPVHEVLHGVCYKKGQKVYIGICLKKFAAFAVCHEPISKRRFVIMSLMPMLLGIIPGEEEVPVDQRLHIGDTYVRKHQPSRMCRNGDFGRGFRHAQLAHLTEG